MEEDELKASIDTYKTQLAQVDQALQAAGPNTDLETLKSDLIQLIQLTEDSLLSLKKGQLLKQLDSEATSNSEHEAASTNTVSHSSIDDEYAAFQELLGDDVSTTSGDTSTAVPSTTTKQQHERFSDIYKDIVGTKCRAPYIHDWGEKSYGNALISSIEADSDLEMPKVRVVFCNPTHIAMLPCKYYLSGNCRFQQQQCRYSHGHIVDLEELQQYIEPDYSQVKLESSCLARYEDDVWYKATVVEMGQEHNVTVMFDAYSDETAILPLEDIFPIENAESDSSSSSGNEDDDITDNQPISRQESDDDEALPVYLWRPPSHGLGDLGQWEAHTKGIGSKLLSKMGYIPGEGLGRHSDGRVQPVPIQLLPQGKSLDKIMTLKALAGDRDMYDVMKNHERKMKKQAEKLENQYNKASKPDMFDFINKKLGGKKGKLSELVHHHGPEGQPSGHKGQGHNRMHRNISEQDLTSKSDRNINIQLLKTSEEMKSVQKELVKLKQSLSRNDRDKNVATKLREKISSLESYLDKLQTSEATMQTHQRKRSDHKKLTVF